MSSDYLRGSWLFFLGSLAFLIDASFSLLEHVSIRSLAYACGCLLFTIGCVYFIQHARNDFR